MDASELESRLGHKFSAPRLLTQALTHRSHSVVHNERLEFLGDSVLNCAVAHLLHERYAKLDEGDLSRLRSNLVKQQTLYEVAQRVEVARHLRNLRAPPIVIFTTAYDEHALAAFESHALDYLLKPVRSERLRDALQRAETLRVGREVLAEQTPASGARRRHVSAVVGGALRLLPIAEILYFQADQGYVSAVSPHSQLLLEDSLRALEDEFAEDFVRIHRNALVAPAHVRGIRIATSSSPGCSAVIRVMSICGPTK